MSRFAVVAFTAAVSAAALTAAFGSGGNVTAAGFVLVFAVAFVPALLVGVAVAALARTGFALIAGSLLVAVVAWAGPYLALVIADATGHGPQ
jgi:hypothetical protein